MSLLFSECALAISEYARFDARIRDLREQLMNTSAGATTLTVNRKRSVYVRYEQCIDTCFVNILGILVSLGILNKDLINCGHLLYKRQENFPRPGHQLEFVVL